MPNPLPASFFQQALVDPKTGKANYAFLKWLQNLEVKTGPTLTIAKDGQIQPTAIINGRTEGISTTVSQLTNVGQLSSADQVAADGVVYSRSTDMVGSSVVVDNGNFEGSQTLLPPPGWNRYVDPNVGLSYDTVTPFSGLNSLVVTTGASLNGGVISVRKYFARPNDTFRISAQAKLISGAGPANVAVTFRDKNGAGLLDANASTSSSSFTFVTGSAIAPVSTVYATIEAYTTPNSKAEFDEIHIARMQTSFEVTPLNTAGTPTTTSGLCTQHSAGGTQIDVASSTWQFGDGQVVYNSGSVNPGSLGTWYVYADDPGFNGGAVTYVATATPATTNAANGRLFFGKITTAAGTATSTGGGSGGGGPSGKAALQ